MQEVLSFLVCPKLNLYTLLAINCAFHVLQLPCTNRLLQALQRMLSLQLLLCQQKNLALSLEETRLNNLNESMCIHMCLCTYTHVYTFI
jgi:hypothetical protein